MDQKKTKNKLSKINFPHLITLVSLGISAVGIFIGWQTSQENRKQEMLLKTMDRIEDGLKEDLNRKVSFLLTMKSSMVDLRNYVEQIYELCDKYERKEVSNKNYEKLLDDLQKKRLNAKVQAIKQSGTIRYIFNDKSRNAFVKFMKWDEEHKNICTSDRPPYETWSSLEKATTDEAAKVINQLEIDKQVDQLKVNALRKLNVNI